jgi:uncharacterized protein YjbI with pentapeptide repeats
VNNRRTATPRPPALRGTTATRSRAGLRKPTNDTPDAAGPAEQPKPERKIRWEAVAAVATTATSIIAVVISIGSLIATRDQVVTADEVQLTNRYSMAIDQLGESGDDRLQVRLGGIYSLERLARDSREDQPTVVEVLTAFVRASSDTTVPSDAEGDRAFRCAEADTSNVTLDVQAALTVLGRRDEARDGQARIDLSGLCLRGANLQDARLAETDLHRADLSSSNLVRADLSEANLQQTTLANAELDRGDLSEARAMRADFSHADLYCLDGAGMYLDHAVLRSASLFELDLSSANLVEVDLFESSVNFSDLSDVPVGGADLRGATLHDVDLTNTEIGDAIVDGRTVIKEVVVTDVSKKCRT